MPDDVGESRQPDDLSLEKVLEEKKMFDLSLKMEKTRVEEGDGGWSQGG